MIPDQPVLKVDEVATILRCGKRAVYDLVHDGDLRSVRVGTSIRIPRSALMRFLGEFTDEGDVIALPDRG